MVKVVYGDVSYDGNADDMVMNSLGCTLRIKEGEMYKIVVLVIVYEKRKRYIFRGGFYSFYCDFI